MSPKLQTVRTWLLSHAHQIGSAFTLLGGLIAYLQSNPAVGTGLLGLATVVYQIAHHRLAHAEAIRALGQSVLSLLEALEQSPPPLPPLELRPLPYPVGAVPPS